MKTVDKWHLLDLKVSWLIPSRLSLCEIKPQVPHTKWKEWTEEEELFPCHLSVVIEEVLLKLFVEDAD